MRPKRDANGTIVGGSAYIMKSTYDKNVSSGHSRQSVVERLGRIVELSPDKKNGVFLSPTRGLVAYDVTHNTFTRVARDEARLKNITGLPPDRERVTFGDVYLLLTLLDQAGLLNVLAEVFDTRHDYERLLAHVVHGFLQDNSSRKCSTLVEQTVLGFLVQDIAVSSLRSDTRFFELMGSDETRVRFFRTFVKAMQRQNPSFGKGCYIDSTPLPNDIHHDNPYNRLRCQGGQGCSEQIRLALVIDEQSGLPVWYELLPGNIMDFKTVTTITRRVKDTLGIDTVSYVLDAGYVSKDVIQQVAGDEEKTLIARMPNKRGYPYKTLYHKIRRSLNQAKYNCFRKGAVYFGKRYAVELFETSMQAYVMIDRERALREYEKYVAEHEADYETHSNSEKVWDSVRFGYFVLLADFITSPQDALNRYLDRVQIEEVFKSSKSFEGLLPLSKWTALTVKGKILVDMIDTIVRNTLLKTLPDYHGSLMDLFYNASSLDCTRTQGSDHITIETPSKQAKTAFKTFGEKIPGVLDLQAWSTHLFSRWV